MSLTPLQEIIAAEWQLTRGPNRERALRYMMRAFGVGVTRCARCGGTGKHGPAHVDGGRCFNCMGWGVFFSVDNSTLTELRTLTPMVLHMKDLIDAGMTWKGALAEVRSEATT